MSGAVEELYSWWGWGDSNSRHWCWNRGRKMTDEEKTIVKEMNRTILDLTYLKSLLEAVLKKRVENWEKEMAAAHDSLIFKEFHRRIEEARGAAELLIESGNLAAARSKGQVN